MKKMTHLFSLTLMLLMLGGFSHSAYSNEGSDPIIAMNDSEEVYEDGEAEETNEEFEAKEEATDYEEISEDSDY